MNSEIGSKDFIDSKFNLNESKETNKHVPKWFEDLLKKNINDDKNDLTEFNEDLNLDLNTYLKNDNLLETDFKEKNSNFNSKLSLENFFEKCKISEKNTLINSKSIMPNNNEIVNDFKLLNIDKNDFFKKLDLVKNRTKNLIESNQDFIIPNLPKGQNLEIILKTNWGDENWIGLNGIEIFDAKTYNLVEITDILCSNSLENKPEVLFDGINLTHDDNHIWKIKYIKNSNFNINIRFKNIVQIALIRIWNYSKSRIHSYRGVKNMIINLNDNKIFDGEIIRSSGESINDINKLGDTILYTLDENILTNIFEKDKLFQKLYKQ